MQIDFRKFVRLTAVIAGGMWLTTACTIEDNRSETGTAGSGPSAGQSNAGEAGEGGTAGAAGEPSSEGGTAGAAGEPSSEGGTAGAAGEPSSEGGTAGAAGEPSSEGGTAGAASEPSSEGGTAGAAGEPSSEGGTAGADSCVGGDPPDEGGMGIDCSRLAFYAEECGPSGEGSFPTYGASICERFAMERQGSAEVLFECLDALTAPESGWCGTAHTNQVDACLADMKRQTCATTAAQTACDAIHDKCAVVAVDQCIIDLSPLDESTPETIPDCIREDSPDVCIFDYKYNCRGLPSGELDVEPVCEAMIADCPALTLDACINDLDYRGIGTIQTSLQEEVELCVSDQMSTEGVTCDVAVDHCGYGGI